MFRVTRAVAPHGQGGKRHQESHPAASCRADPGTVAGRFGAGRRAPDVLTAEFARALFVTSPVVVVAAEGGPALAAAVPAARAAHAPLLVASKITPQLIAAVSGLRPRAVLVVGLPLAALAARLPGIRVVSRAAQLPLTGVPAPLSRVAVLVGVAQDNPAITAVGATAAAAGATVVGVAGGDPRADPAAIEALARLRPREVIGVGSEFGPAVRLGSRLAVAMTGRQLPGGGQVLFPGRLLVALYGHPGTPGLGVLGQQDLTASVARAKQDGRRLPAAQPRAGYPRVRDHRHGGGGVAGRGRELFVRNAGVVAAAVGQPGGRGRHVRRARPPARAR